MICKLLLVDPACAIRLSRKKVLLSRLKFINMTPLDNESRKVQQSDSSKQPQRENSQICLSPPRPNSKEVVTGPRTLKSAARALTAKLISLRAINLLFCLILNFCKGV